MKPKNVLTKNPTRGPRRGPTVAAMRPFALLIGGLVTVAATTVGVAGLARADSDSAPGAERPIIVEVSGDAANGFGIEYAGGGASYPPTDSEAMAECSEYDTRLARVKCRAEVRTWYRDLGDLQASLAYVRAHG